MFFHTYAFYSTQGLPMATGTIGWRFNILLHLHFLGKLQLISRRLPWHYRKLIRRAQRHIGIAVAVQTPPHASQTNYHR
jgi:hypothetical protein